MPNNAIETCQVRFESGKNPDSLKPCKIVEESICYIHKIDRSHVFYGDIFIVTIGQ